MSNKKKTMKTNVLHFISAILFAIVFVCLVKTDYAANISGTISSDQTYEGDNTINSKLTVNYGATLEVKGTLTIPQGVTVNVYGTIKATNIENYGTLNIISNETNYAHVETSKNFNNNNNNGIINLSGGFLIVRNDLTLNAVSALNYSSGESYVEVKGNLIQYKSNNNQEKFGKITQNNYAKGTLIVEGTYTDHTDLDDIGTKSHPWYLNTESLTMAVNSDFTLAVAHYSYDGRTLDNQGNGKPGYNIATQNQDALNSWNKLYNAIKDKNGHDIEQMLSRDNQLFWDYDERRKKDETYEAYKNRIIEYVKSKIAEYQEKLNESSSITTVSGYLEYISKNGVESDIIAEEVAEISSLLPIVLISFNVSQDDNFVYFDWATASEQNNDFFTIEYSIDGITFESIQIVSGSGTTSQYNSYRTSTSIEEFDGLTYFRLKQTDYNGEYSYSDIIAVSFTITNPCSDKYLDNRIDIEGNTYRLIHGDLIYCEGDNEK